MIETIILVCTLFLLLMSIAWLLKAISILSYKTNIQQYRNKYIKKDADDDDND